ncbi:MAG: polysaccharide biosynthesis/export family protein [Saprospiraceae bacterium]|nr:polysaccharide biosynthesis/export family protein [Saprospiraceae bacterium]MCB0623985.1 polysaccharide biosynthesis/export family protein [Saprospiraceae bacterium]MCB0678053.1 polysaccharide biosynthesis/export family protein [Saprospiraceae bacterium]MCB0680145.1 polysaccharide biosynthesis/export family protein [Saprospiraceae bacterium]
MKTTHFFSTTLALLSLAFLCSCGGVKHADLIMLENVQSQIEALDSMPVLVIQNGDILSVQVASRNPETVKAFEQAREVTALSGEQALGVQEGYRVDEEGMIYMPFLGPVKASGNTIVEFRQSITDELVQFIPDVSVQVRFLNFRVTMLGEVSRPNAYVIPNEHINILEAIGMAGDFTSYARRDAVLVIRERNGQRELVRVNTQDISVFESPCFYLQPNDVVYVEPLKAKQYATRGDFLDRYSRLLVPVISLGTFIVGLLITP